MEIKLKHSLDVDNTGIGFASNKKCLSDRTSAPGWSTNKNAKTNHFENNESSANTTFNFCMEYNRST